MREYTFKLNPFQSITVRAYNIHSARAILVQKGHDKKLRLLVSRPL